MKISIITVSYNSARTIERTIQSVLKQNVDELEYILVDGKSSDSTVEIIESYADAFKAKGYEYRYISEEDNGMYDAMNKGIKMSTGDIIGILNSDDWYNEDSLEHVLNKAQNEKSDIYMGSIKILNGDQGIIKRAKDKKYKTSRNFNHPAMFATKQCYDDVGEYRLGNVHNDYGWFLRAMKMGMKLSIIDEVLTNYPTGGAGSKKSIKDTMKRIGTKYQVYKDNGYSKIYYLECVMQELAKYLLLKS